MAIGNRIGAIEKAYYLGAMEDLTLHYAWFPQIEVNGKLVFIKANAPTGKLEARTLGEALQLAKQFRDSYQKISAAST